MKRQVERRGLARPFSALLAPMALAGIVLSCADTDTLDQGTLEEVDVVVQEDVVVRWELMDDTPWDPPEDSGESPNGEWLYGKTEREGSAQLSRWDGQAWGEPQTLSDTWDLRSQHSFSPDSSHFVCVGGDGGEIWIYAWSEQANQWEQVYNTDWAEVWGFSWSPDSQQLVFGNVNDQVQVWDVATREEVTRHEAFGQTQFGSRVAWSPDGRWLAWVETRFEEDSDNSFDYLKVMDAESWEVVETTPARQDYFIKDVLDFSWSPDSARIVLTYEDEAWAWQRVIVEGESG